MRREHRGRREWRQPPRTEPARPRVEELLAQRGGRARPDARREHDAARRPRLLARVELEGRGVAEALLGSDWQPAPAQPPEEELAAARRHAAVFSRVGVGIGGCGGDANEQRGPRAGRRVADEPRRAPGFAEYHEIWLQPAGDARVRRRQQRARRAARLRAQVSRERGGAARGGEGVNVLAQVVDDERRATSVRRLQAPRECGTARLARRQRVVRLAPERHRIQAHRRQPAQRRRRVVAKLRDDRLVARPARRRHRRRHAGLRGERGEQPALAGAGRTKYEHDAALGRQLGRRNVGRRRRRGGNFVASLRRPHDARARIFVLERHRWHVGLVDDREWRAVGAQIFRRGANDARDRCSIAASVIAKRSRIALKTATLAAFVGRTMAVERALRLELAAAAALRPRCGRGQRPPGRPRRRRPRKPRAEID